MATPPVPPPQPATAAPVTPITSATPPQDLLQLHQAIGRLDERIANIPRGWKPFANSFAGAATVAGLVLAVAAVFIPREFDRLSRDIADQNVKTDRSFADLRKSEDTSFADLKSVIGKQSSDFNAKSDSILLSVNDLREKAGPARFDALQGSVFAMLARLKAVEDFALHTDLQLPADSPYEKMRLAVEEGGPDAFLVAYGKLTPDQKTRFFAEDFYLERKTAEKLGQGRTPRASILYVPDFKPIGNYP